MDSSGKQGTRVILEPMHPVMCGIEPRRPPASPEKACTILAAMQHQGPSVDFSGNVAIKHWQETD